jgi:uncharacterized protein (DUF1697 family)
MVGSMQRYVALLRGIAPSSRNMTNDKLRGVFEELGFAAVGSVLASGNITFRTSEADVPFLERRIEEALVSRLGVSSRTIIRECSELRELVDSEPFPGLTHQPQTYLTATFVKDAATVPDVWPREAGQRTRVVRYDTVARAVLAVTDNSVPGDASGFMSWLEKTCGKDITTRSWLTVQRVVKKLES